MHGGALDLVFPHHEAEIAQMESISGLSPVVRYWLHTGFVTVGGQKMSKSLGNFISVRDLLARYGCRVVRFLILRAHYRAPMNFDARMLEQSASGLRRLEEFASTVDSMHDDQHLEQAVAATRRKIQAHLADDFNTPRAIAALFEFVREANASARPGQRTAELLSEVNSLFDFLPSSLSFNGASNIELPGTMPRRMRSASKCWPTVSSCTTHPRACAGVAFPTRPTMCLRQIDRGNRMKVKGLSRRELSASVLYSCERMTITRKDVVHAARLARLGLTDEAIDSLTSELDHILEAMRALQQLDTSAIPPTAQVIPLHDVMREDTSRECWPVDETLQNVPATRDGQFLVPPVLE
jgi:aspartyl/glutamyl-tRNA(Asn/Gln) amidotransferase C subunit